MNPSEKFLVCLYSEPNFLSLNILENLLANNCYVNIFSNDTTTWTEKSANIAAKNRFNISDTKSFSNTINYNYKIFCSGFLNLSNIAKDLNFFLRNCDFNSGKTLVVIPKEASEEINVNLTDKETSLGIIYVGDLLGPRIDLQSDLRISKYLREIINERNLTVPVGEVLYPLFVNDVSKQIVKWLFAFGPFGKEIYLLGQDTSTSLFWQANTKLIGNIKMVNVVAGSSGSLKKGAETHRLTKDLNYSLTETYKWISQNNIEVTKPNKKIPPVKFEKPQKTVKQNFKSKGFKKNKLLLWSLITILLLPLISVLLGGGLSYLAYLQVKSGNEDLAQKIFFINKGVSNVGYLESRALKRVPIIGYFYKELEYSNYVLVSISEMGVEGVPLVRSGSELIKNALGDYPYSVENLLSGSETRLQNVYQKLSLLEEKSIKSKEQGGLVAKYSLSKIDFEYFKSFVLQMSIIADKLPEILGGGDSKTYFVLFENNMELRPTGGFIGSYGLLTFDKGRLTDFTISDVYEADGQLNGHVEPPLPIKQYLGEANWWLRDSNWDPDFPTSAKRAEWFLDKEMDKKVDGVIAIDLNPIKDFLKISGPIYLSDFGEEISVDNFYEKVQGEVEENFFPGTHKKASFLTALARDILNEVSSLSAKEQSDILRTAYTNLEEKHVQVFLHDSEFQNAIKTLGWDGSVYIPGCDQGCYSDLVGLIEANVGVNKSNYFIKRSQKLDIRIGERRIDKTLTLTLSNSANINLGLSGRYKTYIRLLVPEDSLAINVVSNIGQNTESLLPEVNNSKGRKEVGVMVEVLAGETKNITFTWSNNFESPPDWYSLLIRKQAGVESHPLTVNVDTDKQVLGVNPAFSLTGEGRYVYNTTLVKDLFVKFSL